MNKKVAILGAGWLGRALALALRDLFPTYQITILSRSPKEDFDLPIKIFSLEEECVIPQEIRESDYLFSCLPPQGDYKGYQKKFAYLVKALENLDLHWIHVSSTSVYENCEGHCHEDFPIETTKLSERAHALLKIEREILALSSNNLIIRSAGQIGPNRYPARSLINSQRPVNRNEVANVIALEDLLEILLLSLKDQKVIQGNYSHINAVSPHHPSKVDFYQAQAKQLNLDPNLIITIDKKSNPKIIDSKVLEELGFIFRNPKCLP